MAYLTIWGGAGEHGRSSYLLQHGEQAVLLDCGGKKEDGGVYPLIDPEIAGRIQAVFLSHAHEDHSMALPLLYQYGYQGKIWATRATAQQLPSYFAAWERYARSHGHELPYDQDAAARLEFVFLEEQGTAGEWLEVFPGLKLRWGRSGHLPGSVWLLLNWEGRLIYFSGDYTEESMVLAADRPKLPDGVAAADLAIMDAAYGADPDSQSAKLHRLRQATQSALQQGGSVLYPVPVYGRGQELMLWAYDTFPDARLVIEETLLKPLEQLAVKSEWLHSGTSRRVKALLASGRLHCISSHREREEEIANGESAVIFTADGMMETETAKWYYAQLASSSRNTIILTGHLARGSFGDKLLHQPSGMAKIEHVQFKVHQGMPDVRNMLRQLPVKAAVLAHASRTATDRLIDALRDEGFCGLYSLTPGERIEF